MKQSTAFDRKTGFIKTLNLTIYPEELTLLQSKLGNIYLLDAIKKALLKDSLRARREAKAKK